MSVVYPKDFWEVLSKFPNIKSLSDMTAIVLDIENNRMDMEFPAAYALLKEFESSMRSHIYMEHHAREFIHDDNENAS